MNGQVGESRIYNRVLASNEVYAIYTNTVGNYPNPVVTEGLESYYQFELSNDVAGGSFPDWTGNHSATQATANMIPTWLATNTIYLDGDDEIDIPDDAAWATADNAFLIMGWVSNANYQANTLWIWSQVEDNDNRLHFYTANDKMLWYLEDNNVIIASYEQALSWTDGAWYHVAMFRSVGGSYYFLRNGVRVAGPSTDPSQIPNFAAGPTIGSADLASPSYSTGAFGEQRFYKTNVTWAVASNMTYTVYTNTVGRYP